MKKKLLITCSLLILLINSSKAQLSGTFSVPGSYTSVAAAVNDLNTQGVNGPVTINISSGYTETAPVGGYTLTVTGTQANPIVFQKNGAGANPLITAYAGGAGLPSTSTQDGIWRFIGSDYITIDGIDLIDLNTTNPDYMEFGYGFFKAGATDGCQNNTIKNCVVTLNRNNTGSGIGTAVDGSRGIDVVNALTGAHTTALVITSAAGSNSHNKFYNNTLQNCNIGIALVGFADVSPFTFVDNGNDVGGNSGTTGNSIINFGGGVSSTTPAAGIRTFAQYNINASNNTINNNTGSGVNNVTIIRGIVLSTAISANATVNNNTITIKSAVTTASVSMIENISGATGVNNTITITNNLIANCSNTAATTSNWYGIYNSGASCAYLNISNNTFTNNTTNATSGTTYLIYNTGAVTSQINLTNNNLSFSHVGTTAYTGILYNIYNSASSITTTLNINNNNFLSYNHNVTGTGTIYFIYPSASNSVSNINNNLFSNLTLNHSGNQYYLYNVSATQNALTISGNTINNITRNAIAGSMYCYYTGGSSLGTSTQTITNNIVSNVTATVSGSGSFYGFYNTDGTSSPYPKKFIFNNTVSNINYNGTSSFYGMYVSYLGDGSTNSGSLIYNNLIDNISWNGYMYVMYIGSTGSSNYPASVYTNTMSNITSNGASSTIYANYLFGGTAGLNYYKNKTYNITENGSTGSAYGMYISSTLGNVYNNLIGAISTPSSSGTNRLNGIYVAGGTTANISYNTVYLNGTSTGANFGSNAIYASTTPNVNLRNNIFVNNSTPTGTETAVAYRRSSATLTTYSASSNNNLFYAGTPSASNLIYHDGTTPQQTLGSFKTLVSPRDAASVTENPTFVTTSGNNPNFLNINASTPTQIESGASVISTIADDYTGALRNTSTPDIGAWEGNYTSSGDQLPPSFLANGFTSGPCNLTSRTYTMNITDVSGVAGGSLAPRAYYSVNNGPYTSTQGTLTSGSATNGVWTFSMSYAGSLNDVISFYTVAQDIATTPNLGANPSTGFAGINVNNITTPPTNPGTYTLVGTLAGTYSVGATGNFTTLTQAATAYNNSCLAGPVTFVLIDPSYSSSENFPIIFKNNPYASSTNSLLIEPALATGVTISGTTTANSVFKFLNSKYIIIDGLNTGGSSLSILSPTTSAVIWLASTPVVGPGNTNIGIKNTTLLGSANTSGNYGILSGVDGTSPSTTAGIDNDNITIKGNSILTTYYGIYASGTATTTAGLDNWNISDNAIGPVSSSPANIGYAGIYVGNMNVAAINNNTISNVRGTAGYIFGVNLANGTRNATVNLNTINSVKYTGTGGWGGIGIEVNSNHSSANITIQNNMVSDISGDGYSSFTAGGFACIRVASSGSVGGINIQNNSLALNQGTTVAGYSQAVLTAAIYIGASASNVDLRNNILYSDVQFSTNPNSKTYAIYSAASPTAYTNINYNDYYSTGSQSYFSFISAASQTNMAMLASSFGQNTNSQNIAPVFTGINDLHLIPSSNSQLDNAGTPISGITVDIDNQARSLSTPDIGADEYTAPTCTAASSGSLSVNNYSACNGQNISISTNNFSTGGGTIYQWLYSTTPGGPFVNVNGGSGANTPAYISGSLTTGILYYELQTTCASLSLTSVSNIATVAINPVPTASVSAMAPICAGQNLTFTSTTNIGNTFAWFGPNGFTSSVQNPVISSATPSAAGIYTVLVSAANCSATPQTVSVTVNSTNLGIIAAPNYFCTSGTTTMTVLGNAITYTWSTGSTASSIVQTLTATTVYSVAGTGTSNCLATAVTTITVINPTITAIGVAVCSPTTVATLTATSFGPINWYASPSSTVILATANTFTATAPVTTTYYAQASTTNSGSLQTTLMAGNGSSGNMFDIFAINAITINSVDVVIGSSTTSTVEVWYRPGSFVGFESSNAGWISAGTGTVMGAGPGIAVPFNVPLNINIPAGQTYGIYVTSNGGGSFSYSNGTAVGNLYAQNSDFKFFEGKGGSYFGVTISTRIWNGNIYYTKAGCTSPMIPVTITVNPTPTLSLVASQSTVCAGSNVTLTASGVDTYTWSTAATGSVITDAPLIQTTYTVSANSNQCAETYTASTTVMVNPSVPVINITPSATTICEGSLVGIIASGALTFTWSNNATTASTYVNPTVTTVYTVTGSNGTCSGTNTVNVTVNPKPVVTISVPASTVCLNTSSVTLTGSPVGGVFTGSNVSGNAFNPTALGVFVPVYHYTNTTTGCSNTASISITVASCTGFREQNSTESNISVFPNPNNGSFTIKTNITSIKTIEITDLTGRIISVEKTGADSININISELANGLYQVRIQSENGTDMIKVVKQ